MEHKKGEAVFKKSILLAWGLTAVMMCSLFAGCAGEDKIKVPSADETENAAVQDTSQTAGDAANSKEDSDMPRFEDVTIRIGALKGPTSMGLLYLMKDESINKSGIHYEFRMATGADELLPLMIKGELDVALIPANVASVLYAKTEGAVNILDVNTKGVLYMASGSHYANLKELKGQTIYLTGKGTTPDYVLQYLLKENGVDPSECTLEYKSEPTEVAAILAKNPDAIGLLPQPFVTAACSQNEKTAVLFDMNEEWIRVQGHAMVTGVTVVRSDFLKENEEALKAFLRDHAASAQAINDDPATGAVYAVEAGIVAKQDIAERAIPSCNITCIAGGEMKSSVSAYLEVLYQYAPESVGGALPADDFYYLP